MNQSAKKRINEEGINTEIERNPTMSKSAHPVTKKDSEQAYKDAEAKVKETDTKNAGSPLESKDTSKVDVVGFDRDINKGMERLKYDNIDKKFQERVNALVMGKSSPLQKDIDDKEQGVSTKGNNNFKEKAKEMNKHDNDTSGFGKDNKAAVIFGDDLEILDNEKPAHQNSAFENKVKKGEIFVENKKNLKLKVTGLSEDKKSVTFLDENTNKKYTLLKENFKKAIQNKTLIKEGMMGSGAVTSNDGEKGELFNYWASAVNMGDLKKSQKYSNAFYQKFGEHPMNTSWFANNPKLQQALEQLGAMAGIEEQVTEEKTDKLSEPFEKVIADPVTGDCPSPKHGNIKEEKKSRLIFNKTKFLCESHMLSLIPEHYKIDGKQFKMIDRTGNEYLIEWQKNAKVLDNKNEKALKEQMERMKQLWEHKPENTFRKNQEDISILEEVRKKNQTIE
jgi:hypothetical protein